MSPLNNNRSAWLQGPSVPCDSKSGSPEALWRLVLLGAPGVGKGTQAELLTQRLGACHLSTGDVFRAAARAECEPSPAMKEALEFMRRGELVPDSTVWQMVKERAGCLRCGGGFILDGFPRTLGQAESLRALMEKEGIALTAVINYELSAREIVARLSGRRTCDRCKSVYHETERPPRRAGVCDKCEGRLIQREDDRPEAIEVRLETHVKSTSPLIDFYQKCGLLVQVEAGGAPEDIYQRTLAALAPVKTN